MNEKQQALVDAADKVVDLFHSATSAEVAVGAAGLAFLLHQQIVQESLRLRAKMELRRRQRERA